MGPLFWGIVLVVYPLIQIPLVLYASKWVEMDDGIERSPEWTAGPPAGIGSGSDPGTGTVDVRHDATESARPDRSGPGVVVCEGCGALNAMGYTYCRECVSAFG